MENDQPWTSPITLVKKKDDNFRFCEDYRKLNSVTKKDAHTLPRMDHLIDSLQGSKYFSILDLRLDFGALFQILLSSMGLCRYYHPTEVTETTKSSSKNSHKQSL